MIVTDYLLNYSLFVLTSRELFFFKHVSFANNTQAYIDASLLLALMLPNTRSVWLNGVYEL